MPKYFFPLLVITLLTSFIGSNLYGQADPFFMPFEGDVYRIPAKQVMNSKFGYSDKIYDYEKIGQVSWQQIKIPSTETTTSFPDVDRLDQFGMVLHSEMIIKKTGCFSFKLSSDDGSRFWIGDKEIIGNDGMHKMTTVMDTLNLTMGKYPIKLWYYQGFKNKYGFTFDGKYLDDFCNEDIAKLSPDNILDQQTLQLQSKLLFDYNSAKIKDEAYIQLDSIGTLIKNSHGSTITITGFTCNKGNAIYNSALSQKRAAAIRNMIMTKVNRPGVIYRAIGMGDQNPIATNDTEQGRKRNRRVEIKIE